MEALVASLVSSMRTKTLKGALGDQIENFPADSPRMEHTPAANDPPSPKDPAFWSAWIDEVTARLKAELPIITPDASLVGEHSPDRHPDVPPYAKVLQQSIASRQLAQTTLQQATALLDALTHHDPPPVDPNEIEKAKDLVASAQASFEATDQSLLDVAAIVVDQIQNVLSCCFDDTDLLHYCAMTSATPAKLAAWCAQGDEETNQLLGLFQDTDGHGLLRRFFQSGCPRHAEYGRAVQLYRQLTDGTSTTATCDVVEEGPPKADSDAVLERLALAAALELCCELDDSAHSVEHHVTDPIRRFGHYRDAYLAGELDPAFDGLSSWEMRMAINSDASESELQWGRDCLKNYRPDIVTMSDPQWRYCWIVRQDVAYKDPDWYKPERSYDQILSGGGECGPRAWYGRFICKAFGIPTWGVRQPGHAAMSRWTSAGKWMICLGAGFQVSDWDGRCGSDFELETKARIHMNCDPAYLRRVIRLELIAQFCGESDKKLRSTGEPDGDNLWFALSMLQRRLISAEEKQYPILPSVDTWTQCSEGGGKPERQVILHSDGSIFIPAASGAIDKLNESKVKLLPSFLGGKQLFLGKDGEIDYDVDLGDSAGSTFKISLMVCTVHRIQEPLCLIVSTDDGEVPDSVVQISLPYTVGMWQETEPVQADLSAKSRITLKRQELMFGVSITIIKLVPIQNDPSTLINDSVYDNRTDRHE
jgi:hypothetical protein